MSLTEIRIAGFGGQGIILMANIIGKAAALFGGGFATMTQNYGPEARGGASSAQLLLSDEPILYPYVTHPDILIVMSQEAYTRFATEIRPGALLLIEEDLVRVDGLPVTARLHGIPATRFAEELGRKIVLNVVMIGFLAAVAGVLTPEAFRSAIADSVPPAHRDLNLAAFEKGYEFGLKEVGRRLSPTDVPDLSHQEVE